MKKNNLYIYLILNLYFINTINLNCANSFELTIKDTIVDKKYVDNLEKYNNSFLFSIGREIIYNNNNFFQLPDVSTCCDGNFENSIGRALNLGVGGQFYIGNLLYESLGIYTPVFLVTKIGYSFTDLELRREQVTLLSFDEELLDGKFEHLAYFNYNYYFLDFNFQTQLYNNFNFITGIELGKINTLNFSQIERIIQPIDRGVFINDKNDPNYDPKNDFKRSRNEINKSLSSNTSILIYYNIGLSYKLPFFEKLFDNYLDVNFQYGFSNIINQINWTNNRLLINYNIHFDLNSNK